MGEICILLYSHSSYSDIWDLTFSQIYKYINLNDIKLYFCIDNLNDYKLNTKINTIFYDDKDIYSVKILNVLNKLNYKYILFIHEDWVINNNFNTKIIHKYINKMKNNNLLHVRSYKNHGNHNKPFCSNEMDIDDNIKIKNIPINASHFVSMQPGIWEINLLREIFTYNSVSPARVEANINKDINFRKKHFGKFFYENIDNMEKSVMFPHIHSISRGRWAFCNSENLEKLLEKYNIDKKKRGYFNRELNIDVLPI